ncbi:MULTISPECIES: ADP-ribosyltransferase [Terrabacteria group]|uniref:ADP-ribosyltransferase n=1 Tax=Bacillati TaxID=1783272 RepID=UPI001C6EE848|nr:MULTISPECIES: ADP-ribosyltransferase [Terrabacteria group]MBW9213092.1 hypothetical protein [Trueperella sp. zg.1013]
MSLLKRIRYGEIKWKLTDKNNYREFIDGIDCSEWGKSIYSDWAKKYKESMSLMKLIKDNSSLETSPLECYCGYSYKYINEFLRTGKLNNQIYSNMADLLILTLCSAPKIPENIVLYRIVGGKIANEIVHKNKNNEPFQEKGFMSTSLLANIVNEYNEECVEPVLLKIFVPRDTVGVYVNIIEKRAEEEVLLAPNNFLGIIEYPYYDKELGVNVLECQLINFIL